MLNKLRTVMLIDDNEVDLKINSKIITITNLFDKIILCHSGEEALNYLSRNKNEDDKIPDFILLDIQMPEMDGFEFLEIYKGLPKSITDKCVVAILSSTLDFGDIKRAEANPHVVRLFRKPLFPKELEEELKKHL